MVSNAWVLHDRCRPDNVFVIHDSVRKSYRIDRCETNNRLKRRSPHSGSKRYMLAAHGQACLNYFAPEDLGEALSRDMKICVAS